MCGIAGVLSTTPAAWFHGAGQAVAALRRRGPDFADLHLLNDKLIFAATRLAMIDVDARSNQPMVDPDSNCALVFNGELYNHVCLRDELENQGVEFHTSSDTEVVLKALVQLGVQALDRFEGMFALAFWNPAVNRLLLARDSFGMKPLFLINRDDALFFASDQPSLQALSSERQVQNVKTLGSFLQFGYLLGTQSTVANARSLAAGEVLIAKLDGERIHIESVLKIASRDVPRLEVGLRTAVKTIVEEHVMEHRPVALSLSGGLDSAVIGECLLSMNVPFTAFTVSWPDSDKSRYNIDSEYAARIAKKWNVEHVPVTLDDAKHVPQLLRELLTSIGEPYANPTALSQFVLFRRMQQAGFRLALTGDGADELFLGYSRHQLEARVRFMRPPRFAQDWAIRTLIGGRGDKVGKFLRSASSLGSETRAASWHWIFPPAMLRQMDMFAGLTTRELDFSSEAVLSAETGDSPLDKLVRWDQNVWLVDESNRRTDRIAMASSVETRMPFQDRRLYAMMGDISSSLHLQSGGKNLLRSEFPEVQALIYQGPKIGFMSPIGHWLRSNREDVSECATLAGRQLGMPSAMLTALLNSVRGGTHRQRLQLWSLYVLGVWLQATNPG